MSHSRKWAEVVVGIVVFIFALWPEIIGPVLSARLLAFAGVVLVLYGLFCPTCNAYHAERKQMKNRK